MSYTLKIALNPEKIESHNYEVRHLRGELHEYLITLGQPVNGGLASKDPEHPDAEVSYTFDDGLKVLRAFVLFCRVYPYFKDCVSKFSLINPKNSTCNLLSWVN